MKVKDILQLLKGKHKNADVFAYNPNTGDSFEIEQIQEVPDADGNEEYVFAAFETPEKLQRITKEKLLTESIQNLLGFFDTPINRRKLSPFQLEALEIAKKAIS